MYPKAYKPALFGGKHQDSLASVESMLDAFEEAFRTPETTSNFPPYDIVEYGPDHYAIQVALAGFDKEDIDVVMENGRLSITGKHDKEEEGTYLRKGIAKRRFSLSFSLGKNIAVERADFVSGLLTVSMMRLVPEDEKPKQIPVF